MRHGKGEATTKINMNRGRAGGFAPVSQPIFQEGSRSVSHFYRPLTLAVLSYHSIIVRRG